MTRPLSVPFFLFCSHADSVGSDIRSGNPELSAVGDCNLSDEISRSASGKGSGPFLKNILEDFIMSKEDEIVKNVQN